MESESFLVIASNGVARELERMVLATTIGSKVVNTALARMIRISVDLAFDMVFLP